MELKSITFPGMDEPYKTAPGGYGYGEGLVGLGSTNDDAAFKAALSEQFAKTSNKTRQFYFYHGGGAFLGTLWNAGNNYGVLVATSYAEPSVGYRYKQMVRVCTNGTWGDWVDNSPTAFASASHTHENMKLLWTNASPNSSFGEQTLSLNLSGYDFVYVEFLTHCSSGAWRWYRITQTVPVNTDSDWKYYQAVGYSETGSSMAFRAYSLANNQIRFGKSYYAASYNTSTLSESSNLYVPVAIYGIKGVG